MPFDSNDSGTGLRKSLSSLSLQQQQQQSGLRRSRSQIHMGGAAGFGSSTNLAQMAQNAGMKMNLSASDKTSNQKNNNSLGGLKRTSSNLNILSAEPNNSIPKQTNSKLSLATTEPQEGGLGLRRTGSKMSLSEALAEPKTTSNLPPNTSPSASTSTSSTTPPKEPTQPPAISIETPPVVVEEKPPMFRSESSSIISETKNDQVDYFTHQWDVSEIAGSWKYVVSRRQDMANSARLENASWRMWAKARNNLKTIAPEKVDWLKDYDVNWLYGPLYHEADITPAKVVSKKLPTQSSFSPPAQTSTASPRATIYEAHKNVNYRPKSILKKKTLAQVLLSEAHELDHLTQFNQKRPSARVAATNYLRHHQYRHSPQASKREMVRILNKQYQSTTKQHQLPTPSTSPLVDKLHTTPSPQTKPQTPPNDSRQGSRRNSWASSRDSSQLSFLSHVHGSALSFRELLNGDRRVHFNDRVEQCIALDSDEDMKPSNQPQKEVFLSDDSSSDDEDDGGGLFLGLRRRSVLDVPESTRTIAALPATTLKLQEDEDVFSSDSSEEILQNSRRPGFNAQYKPHPVQTYQIVDPHVHAVAFEAKNESE